MKLLAQNGRQDIGLVKCGNNMNRSSEKFVSILNNYLLNKNINSTITKAVEGECPPATQDIKLNLANRQNCIDIANYGPANPTIEDTIYWQKKAGQFKTSVDVAKTMRCANCAAFIKKEEMIGCIEKGIAQLSEEEISKEIVDAANLGYCELFDFKCAGNRTCDAWITNGPIT